jgi:hypothetical protein
MSETFDQFAIVELFGHGVIAGKVSEQIIGGQSFIRVDVPDVDDRPSFTKFFGAAAIYAITPCNVDTVYMAVRNLRQVPIELWKLNLPRLSRPLDTQDDDDNE